MAIRKFRKIMKPFTIVISIVFILSLALGGYESFKASRASNKAQIAFKLNGKTINKVEVERMKSAIANKYSNNTELLDKSILDTLAFNQILNQKLSLDLSKKLKIKVPSAEIEKEFKAVEDSIGDKDQFKRMLEYQGLTKDSFKEQIEENLLHSKTLEAFSAEISPSEEEIKEFYSMNINNR
ncbi:MAG: SurA N-terminal domain-containing protein, partial [Fusobacterium sp.]|nr:SurA N-terminal domain-containing protein [Fusobacterium sp.]